MPISEIESALDCFKRGEPAEAIPILIELIDFVPTYVIAHVMLAQAYEAIQDDEKAVDAWKQAYSVIPGSPAVSGRGWDHPDEDDDRPLTLDDLSREIGYVRERVSLDDLAPLDLAALSDPTTVYPGTKKFRHTRVVGDGEVEGGQATEQPADAPQLTLKATGLTKRYKKRTVVRAVQLEVRQGEIVGLLGPNGAGKTTTFYMIVGLVRPDRGKIILGEDDITQLPMFQRARRGMGYLAQEASIFTQLTVEENLHAVLEYQPLSKKARKARVEELIAEFRLNRVRHSKGYMLSGGERRRTEIARALATKPNFFLLDEPFAGVDPIAVEDIQAIVSRLKEKGIGVLITDHNVHETLAITDRAYLLYEGKILKQGTAEALVSDPEVRKRYLGEKFTLERYEATKSR